MHQQTIAEMIDSPQSRRLVKINLSNYRRSVAVVTVKSVLGRLPETPLHARCQRQPGLNYLCAGYQRYFRHLPPILKQWLICWRTVARPVTLCIAFAGGE